MDAGHDLLARYRRMQHRWDFDQSISHFEHALDICPMDHPCRPAALFNLATAKFVSCQANETYPNFDIPISIFQDALELRPTGHPDRPATQLHLAIALLSRFMKQGFLTDADAAEELLSKVLNVCHANSLIHRAALLAIETSAGSTTANDLGQEQPTASIRPLPLNQLVDMTVQYIATCMLAEYCYVIWVIALCREVLPFHPVGRTFRWGALNNLTNALFTRFEYRGNDEDLDEAITLRREALALHPIGPTDWSRSLNDLAGRLSTRFDRRGNDEDLDEAITLHREALALHPVGHTDRYWLLNDLADLDEAIALHREALALCPIGHTDQSRLLNNLAKQLSTRFEHQGNAEDLDEAIVLQSDALALRLVGHPDRSQSLNDLANCLHTHFKWEALALHTVGDTDRSLSLNNLAVQLSTRFGHRGNGEDLDEAIAHHREALALRPVSHTDRYWSLNNLAGRLSTRFEHRGNDEDLNEAIAHHREALALCPVGHTDRSRSLTDLAGRLSTCFEHRGKDEDLDEAMALLSEALALCPIGNDEDLDEAIALHREALALRPVGHIDRYLPSNNFASQLYIRFETRGNDEDLDEAIALHREVLALLPGLSSSFQHRRSNDEEMEEAIALHREALALCPLGHTNRSLSLYGLAVQLGIRFDHQGNDEDLDEAIALHREALALYPVGHADRPWSLNGLADRLSTRFDHRGRVKDLNKSRDVLHCLLTLLTQHDPHQLRVHQSLAEVCLLFHRSRLDGNGPDEDIDSLNAAMDHFQAAANIVSGCLLPRLLHSHGTELEACTTTMRLLDTHMPATASVSSRHNVMSHFPSMFAVDAASCALRSGDVHRAVELLEQGRTVIWTQMTRLRTPLDDLQTRGDHAVTLMKRFKDLSSLLDKPPASRPEGTPRVDIEAEEIRYRHLVEDWNGAVEEIRKIEGFSRFLLPPLFSDLQDAARDGPIIMLIATKWSCNAIIILHKQPPTSIQLPTNFEKLKRLMLALQEAVEKDASPKGSQPALVKTLRELWNNVVRPVVENLGEFAQRGSRIWWCPTSLFNFLPLHAAGEYRANGESLSQQYTSSYTPSLTALMRARKSHDRSLSVFFTAIGQNRPAGALSTLDSVEPELELVRSLLLHPPTVSFTKITSIDATKSRAQCALRDNTWVHFACHGTQKFDEPFNSAFHMRDHPLSLLNITQMDLSRHQFAFLLACETAVGVPRSPDEVIHLAAGLQFAGVKSVVGTLWKVNDNTVQRLVKEFYTNLCGDGKMNSKRAARALHRAAQSLARDKDMPLDQHIVFMHIGV
ncbi:CHAT domain-containing protein [Suillus subalutaceus]|uniref:CHAT domain-containing protein n=1 Tax=Suillus subalutaceus TaxID=48586 RepID=UPI001B87710E|nr:CHAT domain-containing protein [Suillus subalutaceus]KAG1871730.1 CHAT domain-containing protein [Suillus subalutaceus]